VRHRPVSDRCHGEGPRRCRLLLRLTSPRTRRVGWEAWPSGVRVSPARPAGARVPYPFPWQRLARLHACAPVSAAAPPQRLQRCKSFCISLFKLSSPLERGLIAFESVPSKPPQPRGQPVPSPPSWPCPAARACCRQGWLAAGALAQRGAGSRWRGVGGQMARHRVDARGRWKRPFVLPILEGLARVASVAQIPLSVVFFPFATATPLTDLLDSEFTP
jgi:hypothetical protein